VRLWSLHPSYLDGKGLVALWREALLARKVLQGRTKGYRRHPQLVRFRELSDPVSGIDGYLRGVHAEALCRGFRFDAGKIIGGVSPIKMTVTDGQLRFEMEHLKGKLRKRDRNKLEEVAAVNLPEPHPIFKVRKGLVEVWEKNAVVIARR
jgi:hypothetical protein